MAVAKVDGLSLGYDVIGDAGRPWVITPGGRFTKESPGVRELAVALAERGATGCSSGTGPTAASPTCASRAPSESAMQADALAGAARAPRHGARRHRRAGRAAPGCRCSPPPATPRSPPGWPSGGSAAACTACCRWPRTTAADRWARPGPTAWRRWPTCPSGPRSCSGNPSQPPALPGPGPGDVHRHHGALDAGLLPARGRARAGPARRRRACAGHPGARVPQRRERRPPHPGDVRGAGRAAAPGPAGRAAVG